MRLQTHCWSLLKFKREARRARKGAGKKSQSAMTTNLIPFVSPMGTHLSHSTQSSWRVRGSPELRRALLQTLGPRPRGPFFPLCSRNAKLERQGEPHSAL